MTRVGNIFTSDSPWATRLSWRILIGMKVLPENSSENLVRDRHVLITGGTGHLGRALAQEFQLQRWITHSPGKAALDVASENGVRDFIGNLNQLDVLVANAGLARDKSMVALPSADFSHVLDVNLKGTFYCVREALRLMMPQRSGHLLLIGSRAAKFGTHGQSAYAASKAALVAFAQSIAREYGPRNIRCNVVLPGFLETKFTANLSPERKEFVRQEHALQRFNTLENAARFIAFLAATDHVSGQVFTLDSRIDSWT